MPGSRHIKRESYTWDGLVQCRGGGFVTIRASCDRGHIILCWNVRQYGSPAQQIIWSGPGILIADQMDMEVSGLREHVCIEDFLSRRYHIFNKEYAHHRTSTGSTSPHPSVQSQRAPPLDLLAIPENVRPAAARAQRGTGQVRLVRPRVPDREPRTPTLRRSRPSEAISLTPSRVKLLKSSGSTGIIFYVHNK
jgi:hypothetical protein